MTTHDFSDPSLDSSPETSEREAKHGLERMPISSLRSLFESWSSDNILYQDADIIAVDKPEGLSTHAPDEVSKDDVHSRLLAWLSENPDGEPPYLGIHQRLDRDTSGVLIFTRRKSANARIAEQFEQRRVAKTYVAVVEGKLRVPPNGILRHLIEEGRDGVRIAHTVGPAPAAPKRGRGTPAQRQHAERGPVATRGKEAITEVRVLDHQGERWLLELAPKTGRTHQIRVQLAAAGAPVVGDAMYGGAPARRLMLHARELRLNHPSTGEELVIASKTPAAFGETLQPANDVSRNLNTIETLLREAANKRYGAVQSGDTDAVRLFNGAGDGVLGVAVDAYGDALVVHITEDIPAADLESIYDAALGLGASSVYVKHRPKHASRVVDARRAEFSPKLPVRGVSAPSSFLVHERGVPYEVSLEDGLSTGLFLDQRENRARVREWSAGARVLNLFAYTGSFSVVAALGGASSTTTVDVSRSIAAWASRNLARVGADPEKHVVIEADCFGYLDQAATRAERFDLVVLDPPSFATTKSSRFSADGDYRKLAAKALSVVAPGGRLLACTNHQGIVMAKFRRFLHEASRDAGVTVSQVKSLPPPDDFPPAPGMEPHLKAVVMRLG